MEHGEFLFTIAEVAVAFVGFASIVGILGRRSTSSPSSLNALRMRIMVLHGLVVVAFSLVPYLLYSYGVDGVSVWRASSGLYVIVSAIVGVSLGSRVRRALSSAVARQDRVGVVAIGIFAVEVVLSLGNVLGLFQQVAAAIYLTTLALRMLLSGLAFSSVIFSFIDSSDSDE